MVGRRRHLQHDARISGIGAERRLIAIFIVAGAFDFPIPGPGYLNSFATQNSVSNVEPK